MCCQESGEREASVSLFCPKAKQGEKKFRKVLLIVRHRHVFITIYILQIIVFTLSTWDVSKLNSDHAFIYGTQVDIIYTDFTKDLDHVDHNLLIKVLLDNRYLDNVLNPGFRKSLLF